MTLADVAAPGSYRPARQAAGDVTIARSRASRVAEPHRPAGDANSVPQLLDALAARGELDDETSRLFAQRLFPHLAALRRAQRTWTVQMLLVALVMLFGVSGPWLAGQLPASAATMCSVVLGAMVPVMVLVERRRQRRVASTMLLVRLLRHAHTLGGESDRPDIDGGQLRRGLTSLEVTATIARIDCVRQLSGEHPNPALTAAGRALADWICSVSAQLALAGPVQIRLLRADVVRVAAALAGDGFGTAAAVAAALTPATRTPDRAVPRPRRAAAANAARLTGALLLLLAVRHLTRGLGVGLGVTLDAAIGAVTLAGVAWCASGVDPQAMLHKRWMRWAASPSDAL
jgi:hypothetical protein